MDENYFPPTIVTHSQESVKSQRRLSIDVGGRASLGTFTRYSYLLTFLHANLGSIFLADRTQCRDHWQPCHSVEDLAMTRTTLETFRNISLLYKVFAHDATVLSRCSKSLESTRPHNRLCRHWEQRCRGVALVGLQVACSRPLNSSRRALHHSRSRMVGMLLLPSTM